MKLTLENIFNFKNNQHDQVFNSVKKIDRLPILYQNKKIDNNKIKKISNAITLKLTRVRHLSL